MCVCIEYEKEREMCMFVCVFVRLGVCMYVFGHQPENCPTVSSTTIDFAYLAGATQEPSTERSDRLKSGPSQDFKRRSRSENIFVPARCRA